MSRTIGGTLILILLGACTIQAEEAPIWLRQASANLPEFDGKAKYAVLRDESLLVVDEQGRFVRTATYAIKVLLKEGRENAVAEAYYNAGTDKIREFRAWLLLPSGEVKKYEKKETVDVAQVNNDVYNEAREKIISARNDAEAGAVFGFETVQESRLLTAQDQWFFQGYEPVVKSRLTVRLPAGWTAQGVTYNHAPVQPAIHGSSYTWELGPLSRIEPEPLSPSAMNVVPRLNISFFPPPGVGASATRTFQDWSAVSLFVSELNDPQAILNEAMIQKARELTAGSSSEIEKIRAIARFVQEINYVSIQIDVGRGGGYRPHSAAEVFAKHYGDCKDKANLMRTLLRAVEISAYPLVIYAGDRYFVQQNWPSPRQFNHCIVAIQVKAETEAPAIVPHDRLGRLLIFDPTDEHTVVGDLPETEQGSWALLAAGAAGGLIRVPELSSENHQVTRRLSVELLPNGSIQGHIVEDSTGQSGRMERRSWRDLTPDEYNRMIERWVSFTVNGAKVTGIQPRDDRVSGLFHLEVGVSAERYGKLMQGRLMSFVPAFVSRRETVALSKSERHLPIVINGNAFAESAEVILPAGFIVDELPDPVKLETSFGQYTASYNVEGNKLRYQRAMTVRNAILPAEQYSDARNFYDTILASEQAPVVLIKK
jgi:hypothetical protein